MQPFAVRVGRLRQLVVTTQAALHTPGEVLLLLRQLLAQGLFAALEMGAGFAAVQRAFLQFDQQVLAGGLIVVSEDSGFTR